MIDRVKFGFLPVEHKIEFDGGSIIPLPNFDEIRSFIDKHKHKDGFLYPPLIHQRPIFDLPKHTGIMYGDPIPNTERPALLHRPYPSHELLITDKPIDDDLRKNDGAFLMYLASYLFGVRLQFHDWWIDGRIPIKSKHNIYVDSKTATELFSFSYQKWKKWPENIRIRFINILYMNSRTSLYEWDWERFISNYMVFDALHNVAVELSEVKAGGGHEKRLKKMCEHFGLAVEEGNITGIYKLRNDLFHEALWDKNRPCGISDRGFYQSENLRRLNQRLILAILGYKTNYIATSWARMGTFKF